MPGAPGSKPLPSTARLATGGAGPPHPPPPPARARRCARQLKLNSGSVKTRGALNFAVIETKTEPGHCLPGRGQQARPPGGFPAPSSTASPTGSSPIPPSGSSDAASLIWHENKSGSFHPSVPGQCHLRGQLCPGRPCPGRPCGGQDAPAATRAGTTGATAAAPAEARAGKISSYSGHCAGHVCGVVPPLLVYKNVKSKRFYK